MPSLNVFTTNEELLRLIRQGGSKSLTFAVESDEATRKKMAKGFSDQELLEISNTAIEIGFDHIKYYFIIGMPGQDDLSNMKSLILKLKRATGNRMKLSVNPFVPKRLSYWKDEKFD